VTDAGIVPGGTIVNEDARFAVILTVRRTVDAGHFYGDAGGFLRWDLP